MAELLLDNGWSGVLHAVSDGRYSLPTSRFSRFRLGDAFLEIMFDDVRLAANFDAGNARRVQNVLKVLLKR